MSKSPATGAKLPMPAASEPIAAKSLRALRARAHALKPVVWIASTGPTEGVVRELDRALAVHELVKIHAAIDERKERSRLLQSLCRELDAEPVQIIGKMLVAFRPRPQPTQAPMSSQSARRTARKQGGKQSPTKRARASGPPAKPTRASARSRNGASARSRNGASARSRNGASAGSPKAPAATTQRVRRPSR